MSEKSEAAQDLLLLCASVVKKVTGRTAVLSKKHQAALETVVATVEGVKEKGKAAVALYEALEPDLKKIKAALAKVSSPGEKRSVGDKKAESR